MNSLGSLDSSFETTLLKKHNTYAVSFKSYLLVLNSFISFHTTELIIIASLEHNIYGKM
jgi:hypothetical protein